MEDVVHYARRTLIGEIPFEVYVRRSMKFTLGRIVWTRAINDRVADDIVFAKFVMDSLKRHANCDWGEIDNADKQRNNEALENGERLFSAYMHHGDRNSKVWIITESGKSVTTILFPSEY